MTKGLECDVAVTELTNSKFIRHYKGGMKDEEKQNFVGGS
jgi:hypothetical protein